MLIALCGKSASGKTTILNELEKLGVPRIVTMTTRPKRPGEIEGKTYYFRDEEEFKNLMYYDFFAETTSYCVADGSTWHYGTPKEKLFGDGAIILNPDGLRSLKDKYKMLVFYLDVPEFVLERRLKKRGDKKDEARRRLAKDEEDFYNIKDYCDWVIGDWWSSPEHIAKKIKTQYDIWCHLQIGEKG